MKRILLLLTLGTLLACPSFAQSTNSPPPGPPPGGPPPGGRLGMLTDAEKQELKAAHDAAIQANPSLGTEGKDLGDQMRAAREAGQKPSDDLLAQMQAYHKKLNAAMIAADPNVAPIIAKMDAGRHHWGQGGPPPPPPGN